MEYLLFVIVALVANGSLAPLVSGTTREIPPTVTLFLSTMVFLGLSAVVLFVTDTGLLPYAFGTKAAYIYVAGLFLAVGIIAYFFALRLGPVSIVVPIFGMFIVGSAIIGILFLGEALTLTRAGGIACAFLAIYLSAGAE